MRKIALIIFFIFLGSLSALSIQEEKPFSFRNIKNDQDSSGLELFSLAPVYNNTKISPAFPPAVSTSPTLSCEKTEPSPLKTISKEFSLHQNNSAPFNFTLPRYELSYLDGTASYSTAFMEISGINLAVWSFDKFILKKTWAQISVGSIYNNLNNGFEWDNGTFISNQFAHPYHGAMYFSAARLNGLDFMESVLFTTSGSLMWELFFESNYPSINDTVMTTLGGVVLGGPLFQIAGMLMSQQQAGIKGIFQKSLMTLINPYFGYSSLSGKNSGLNFFTEDHHYSFHLPLGTYWSSTNIQKYLVGICIENKDFREKDLIKIKPYDWFLLDFQLGISREGPWDKEISTTVLLSGAKTEFGLSGLFGVYDYIDTQIIDRVSAAGVGIGAVSTFHSEPDFFTDTSGVVSFIFGGSSPSLDTERCHFGQVDQKPYYFGPGMMSRFRIETGKKGFGSILAKFSHYWINSLFSEAKESLSISSFNLKFAVTKNSYVNLGYDCYIRQGTIMKKNEASFHGAMKVFFVHKF